MRPWTDYYPNGRYVYYEGDDPHTFVREMKTKFNFDPSKEGKKNNFRWNDDSGWCFFLPGYCIKRSAPMSPETRELISIANKAAHKRRKDAKAALDKS